MAQEVPSWVNSPEKACSTRFLCAVGEGTGFQTASASARNELAKIFGTKVISKFQVTTTSDNITTEQMVNEDLEESTEQLLEGVEITKRYDGKTSVYVVASLDKVASAKVLKNQIQDLDQRLESHYKEGTFSGLYRSKRIFNQRQSLNERYEFLKGNRIPETISFKDLYELQKRLAKGKLVRIEALGKEKKKVKDLIENILTGIGFRVVRPNLEFKGLVVEGNLKVKEAFLNVKGFKKFEFIFSLSCFNKKKQKIGNMNYSKHFTGRDENQATEKAYADLAKYIKENIDDLNF